MDITVIWSMWHDEPDLAARIVAHGEAVITSKTITTPSCFIPTSDHDVLEALFEATNLYEGPLWDALQPLPEDRSHTALSVGDHVVIDGTIYRCDSFGWSVKDSLPTIAKEA